MRMPSGLSPRTSAVHASLSNSARCLCPCDDEEEEPEAEETQAVPVPKTTVVGQQEETARRESFDSKLRIFPEERTGDDSLTK